MLISGNPSFIADASRTHTGDTASCIYLHFDTDTETAALSPCEPQQRSPLTSLVLTHAAPCMLRWVTHHHYAAALAWTHAVTRTEAVTCLKDKRRCAARHAVRGSLRERLHRCGGTGLQRAWQCVSGHMCRAPLRQTIQTRLIRSQRQAASCSPPTSARCHIKSSSHRRRVALRRLHTSHW